MSSEMNATPAWMLYGANGYTGRLIAAEAARCGLKPVLAGRNREAVQVLARETGCEARVFSLDDSNQAAAHLAGLHTVLNCAGPFSATAVPMMEACLKAKANYLDITGEIDVIEAAASRHERAVDAGVALLPAVGFDVVPSDCLAAMLAAKLPTASHLILAFSATGGPSPGTAKTAVENAFRGGRIRRDGIIQNVPSAWKARWIPFRNRRRYAVTIPWGDVSSAYHSTGIGNIEIYFAATPFQVSAMRLTRWLSVLTRPPVVQRFLKRQVERRIPGPTPVQLAASRASFWGQVSDDAGRAVQATLETPGGYPLTVSTALAATERVLGRSVPPGFSTPSKAFGREFVLEMPGTSFEKLE